MNADIKSPTAKNTSQVQEDSKSLTDTHYSLCEQLSLHLKAQELVLIYNQSKRIQQLTEAMAKLPVLDRQRIDQIKQQLEQGTLDALSQDNVAQQAIDRIVTRLLEIDSALESSTTKGS